MPERAGYRGYIGSRPLLGNRTPQHIQNIVIRDYARRKNLEYLLSGVEYGMPNCFMILEDVLTELDKIRGIICYSMFMLPDSEEHRRKVYDRVLSSNSELHAAVEELAIRKESDIPAIEEIFLLQKFVIVKA